MKYMGLNEIRESFLSFFESKGHLRHPSFSLIPSGDASLLLTSSGMVPFKPYFSGEVTPPKNRMTTCQKCVRVNDIEQVGKTSRHCTFFEMLGHFSFGDYFKREAIAWTWEFYTQVMEIDPAVLYPSVYFEDDEAYDIWVNEIGVDPARVIRLGKEDNFWEIGSGPCGPSSEIYFDRGADKGCGKPDCQPGCECDRFIEIGNNVFTQFHSDGEGNYTPLTQRNIDFGGGLERLALVIQGVDSVHDIDTIQKITQHVVRLSNVQYGFSEKTDISLRIISDHIRSTTMLVCDGVLPSNEGRGYVLRRLLRRAARHGKLLGIEGPFLRDVCKTVIEESKGAYPELGEKEDFIQKVISMEEERFQTTIDSGMKLLSEYIEKIKARHEDVLDGEDAFKLYDTYGFPIDLTLEILGENGLGLYMEKFEALMQEQKERARAARTSLGDLGWVSVDLGLDKDAATLFTGYESFEESAEILAIVVNGELSSSALEGQDVSVVLDRTPFYAESGGQVSDYGVIFAGSNEMQVRDVRKTNDSKYIHSGKLVSGTLRTGDRVTAKIDDERRRAIMRAHSATHLLQKALRTHLGSHVEQAGSLVEPDKLRFDFTHFAAVTPGELLEIEREVNNIILAGYDITVSEMPIADAKKLGAMALFGEKYGDTVRVVQMGDYSVELCGGTHLNSTAMAGMFKVVSEGSVAAGVRRIEAHVGHAVLDDYDRINRMLISISELMKSAPGELPARVRQNIEDMKALRREIESLHAKQAVSDIEGLLRSAKDIGGIKLITAGLKGADPAALRQMGDFLRDKEESVTAVLASQSDDKITFLAVCGKDAVSRGVHAGNIIREVTKAAGGSGGGKPDSAMGGGRDSAKIDDALSLVAGLVEGMLK